MLFLNNTLNSPSLTAFASMGSVNWYSNFVREFLNNRQGEEKWNDKIQLQNHEKY